MANENKPLNEAKPNEPITAQRWNDMQLALRKEHIEHRHNGTWKDGNYSGDPLAADGLADNAVITSRIADAAVTPNKLDPSGDFRARSLNLLGDKPNPNRTILAVAGPSVLSGPLRVSPGDRDSLIANDSFVEVGGGGNPLRFTSVWSSFTEGKANNAEISNDTNAYKSLMIVGNRSAGGVRKVAIWDRLDVMGRLVVGPGLDAGITANGPIDGTIVRGNDFQTVTLGVAALATVAQLKVNGVSNTGPVNVAGGLNVTDVVAAPTGLRIGPAALQPFNRVQIQSGALHMDGNPIYLRASVVDQYDLLRWSPSSDVVELGGYQGVNLGFTKNAVNVVAPAVTVRDGYVDIGLNGNPLRLSTNWQNTPAAGLNNAEISNDTVTYKTLMVIGNRSNNAAIRRVSVWDRLEVNGDLAVSVNLSTANLNVTGQTNLAALRVSGAIVPSVGNNSNAGIMFPTDPGGGGGDAAFIRYSVESGEITTFRIGIENDPDDALRLYQAGGDRLHIQNARVTVGSAAYVGGEARYLNAEGEIKSFGAGAGYRMSDRNEPNNAVRDWVLHPVGQTLRFWNATTGDAGTLTAAGRLTVNKIQLGNKFLLSGDGDVESNDFWLRLKSATGATVPPYTTGYYGGFAAWYLWSWNGVNTGSDRALKRDIAPLASALDRICQLRGVSFRGKDDTDNRLRIGLVAQEVQEFYPEVVAAGPDGFLGVQYEALVAPLVEAVKEQQQQIRGLRRELADLRERLV